MHDLNTLNRLNREKEERERADDIAGSNVNVAVIELLKTVYAGQLQLAEVQTQLTAISERLKRLEQCTR